MKKTIQNALRSIDSLWQSSAKEIALVSGVFSLIVILLLSWNYIEDNAGLPEKERIYSQELAQAKARLNEDTNNEELKQEIRHLDLDMRQAYFKRRVFSERGKYLLVVGIVIFLVSIKKVSAMQKKVPRMKVKDRPANLEAQTKLQARKAVGAFGIILMGCVIALALAPSVDIPAVSPELATADTAEPEVEVLPSKEEYLKNWPRFRGPYGTGIVTQQDIPISWDVDSGEGILWKAEVPLPGNNSPIVWGDRVFLSGATKTEKAVYCYSVETGGQLWKGDVNDLPAAGKDELNIFGDTGYASNTMATDGLRVYAIFADGDLAAFDFKGERVWAKNLGVPDSIYGYATSLMTYKNLVIVQYDQGGDPEANVSVLYAFDGKTGEIAWQTPRPVANAWTSPIVIDTGEGDQIVTCSEPWVIGYEAGTGTELWRADLLGPDLAPSPAYAHGLVIAVKPGELMYGIKTDGRGDITESHIAFELDCAAPDICSPVGNDDYIFLLGGGYLSCHSTKDGKMFWEHAFDDQFQASPSLVGEWLYLVSDEGNTYRVKAAKEIEVDETVSHLKERVLASPAFIDGRIIIRGETHLFCMGKKR